MTRSTFIFHSLSTFLLIILPYFFVLIYFPYFRTVDALIIISKRSLVFVLTGLQYEWPPLLYVTTGDAREAGLL